MGWNGGLEPLTYSFTDCNANQLHQNHHMSMNFFCLDDRIRTCEHVLPRHAHITNCGTSSFVGVARLELTTSCSQSTHTTNCTIPRTIYFPLSTVAILSLSFATIFGFCEWLFNWSFNFFNLFSLLFSFAIIFLIKKPHSCEWGSCLT